MNLYIVRHGETVANAQAIHQDGSAPLSDEGHKQAETLATRFTSIPIDLCICSTFTRAMQTAKVITATHGFKTIFDDRLVEIKRPTEIEGKSMHDPVVKNIKQQIIDNASTAGWYHSDEEKTTDLMDRIYAFIQDLEERKEENVLVVSHGETIRTLVLMLMYRGQATPDLWQHFKDFFDISNTSITLLKKYDDETPSSIRGWKLITWNDHAHLG